LRNSAGKVILSGRKFRGYNEGRGIRERAAFSRGESFLIRREKNREEEERRGVLFKKKTKWGRAGKLMRIIKKTICCHIGKDRRRKKGRKENTSLKKRTGLNWGRVNQNLE